VTVKRRKPDKQRAAESSIECSECFRGQSEQSKVAAQQAPAEFTLLRRRPYRAPSCSYSSIRIRSIRRRKFAKLLNNTVISHVRRLTSDDCDDRARATLCDVSAGRVRHTTARRRVDEFRRQPVSYLIEAGFPCTGRRRVSVDQRISDKLHPKFTWLPSCLWRERAMVFEKLLTFAKKSMRL